MSVDAGRSAVFVRAHVADEKTLDLLKTLSSGRNFDLFVLANETSGVLAFPGYAKIAVSAVDFEDQGFPCARQYTMKHLSDVILGILKERAPGYGRYLMVEYDVQIEKPGAVSAIVEKLDSAEFLDIDLAGINLGPQPPSWPWHAAAHRRYGYVLGSFFPIVVLSGAAIDLLTEERRRELAERTKAGLFGEPDASGAATDWVFCEAFVPSALAAWGGGRRMVDLNAVLPHAYRQETFNIGPPELFQAGARYDDSVALVHPVCIAEDMLLKRLYIARATGQLPAFVDDLESGRWPIADDLRDKVRGEALH